MGSTLGYLEPQGQRKGLKGIVVEALKLRALNLPGHSATSAQHLWLSFGISLFQQQLPQRTRVNHVLMKGLLL